MNSPFFKAHGFAVLLAALLGTPLAAQVNLPLWGAAKICPSWGCGNAPGKAEVMLAPSQPYLGPTTNLHLEFPIFNRNTGTPAQVQAVLVYNSSFWGAPSGGWQPEAGSGWWLRTRGGSVTVNEQVSYGACGWTDGDGTDDGTGNTYNYTLLLQEPDGSLVNAGTVFEADPPHGRHLFDYYWDCPTGDTLPESFGSGDGKGFTIDANGTYNSVTAAAWDGAGNEVDNGFVDRNGNAVRNSGGTITDPLGTAVTVSGAGTPSSPVTYTYTGPGNTPETITVLYESAYATTTFGCFNGWSGNFNVPQTIIYPDGATYNFSYDSAGRLATVTQPGGGTVSYSYFLAVQCSPFYITDSLTQSDSLDPNSSWSWNHDTSNNLSVQTDPYGDAVVTTLDSGGNPSQVDVHIGGQNTGLISRTITTGTLTNRTATTELCVSATDPCGASDTTKLESAHSVTIDGYGFLTATSDTDWGVNGVGATLRQTANTYQASGNGEVLVSVKTMDGGGNQAALTTLSNFDGNGNPQSENDYSSNTASLTTTSTYNSNGTVATVTQPNGEVTTLGYQCGSGLLPSSVQIKDAASNILGTTSAVWDCNGGVETSTTDLNGLSTTTGFDLRWRPQAITAPDGAVTNFTYPSSANGFAQSERSMNFNGSVSTDDELTTLDPLGRPIIDQRRNGQQSTTFDSVQSVYDAMGRVTTVSMPYSAAAGVSAPAGTAVTTTTYDALSRPIKVVDGGGGEADYNYVENDVTSTVVGIAGAPSVVRQDENDGLGRLRSVCEITGGVAGWPNGPCGQTAGRSGYLTAYTRNALGQVTQVNQDSQPGNGGAQQRTFAFDQQGRLTSESNPESGSTAYFFDTGGACPNTSPGDLVARQDAAGNVTCYAYDGFHHVSAITYTGPNAGVTASKSFVYGRAGVPVVVDGVTMQNVVGRLAEAYTGSRVTDEGFSYPDHGDEADVYQLSPNSGGWYYTSSTIYPNGAPASLNLSGLTQSFTYGVDGEGRPTTVSASAGQSPVTSATTTPLGLTNLTFGSGDSDAFTFDPQTGRMTQYQFSVGGQTDTGTVGWYVNGDMKSLGISDAVAGTGDNGYSCTYSHDDIGRLQEANCGAGDDQQFSFDPFGNHNTTGPAALVTSFTFNNNRITNSGANYDLNGNLLSDPLLPSQANSFDAEGKPVTLEGVSVLFDALGRAVEAGGNEFVYGTGGAKIAVMTGQSLVRADIPLPGGAVAVYNSSGLAYYRHADGLGSARLSSDATRHSLSSDVYAPFGYDETSASGGYRSFTGQKQDIDSSHTGGQYDFLMREFNPIQGRWWTPDPAGLDAVDPEEPQSWNRFAYVGGRPLEETDEYGCVGCPGGSHPATGADAAKYIATAESYIGQRLSHPKYSHYGPQQIDCSGLLMCSFAGAEYSDPLTRILTYLGINLTTRNLDQWSVPGTGAVGDVIYFAKPGHVGIVTGAGTFIGSQSSTGPAKAQFGLNSNFWGTSQTSSPVFRRPCIKDPPPSPGGGGGAGGGIGGGNPSGNPFAGVDQGGFVTEWICTTMTVPVLPGVGVKSCHWKVEPVE